MRQHWEKLCLKENWINKHITSVIQIFWNNLYGLRRTLCHELSLEVPILHKMEAVSAAERELGLHGFIGAVETDWRFQTSTPSPCLSFTFLLTEDKDNLQMTCKRPTVVNSYCSSAVMSSLF
ncbi:hypothetical protein AOLI_G00138040 [Acnodon oligacanthus]